MDDCSFWASTGPRTSTGSVAWSPVSARAHATSSEDRVREVGPRLGQAGDGVALGRRAVAKAGNLWEHEPHPVAALAAGQQFGQRGVVGTGGVLRVDEALEVEPVHATQCLSLIHISEPTRLLSI